MNSASRMDTVFFSGIQGTSISHTFVSVFHVQFPLSPASMHSASPHRWKLLLCVSPSIAKMRVLQRMFEGSPLEDRIALCTHSIALSPSQWQCSVGEVSLLFLMVMLILSPMDIVPGDHVISGINNDH